MAEEYFPFFKQAQKVFGEIKDTLQQSESLSSSWNHLAEKLVAAEMSPQVSQWIIQYLQQKAAAGQIHTGTQLYEALLQVLTQLLENFSSSHSPKQSTITIITLLGEKYPGKSIGEKLALHLNQEGRKIFLFATNRFQTDDSDSRYALLEKVNIQKIRQHSSLDTTVFVFDTLNSALLQGYDLILIESFWDSTAEKNHLKSVVSAVEGIQQVFPHASHELLLIIDAMHVQEKLSLLHPILEVTGLTGVILSKIDRSVMAGIVFTVVDDLGVPIQFLDTDEKDQLVSFDPEKFITELFENT